MAANLAYLLSREHQGQVLLVDLDLQYGQLVYFFDIKTRHTLSDVIAHLEEMDHSYLQNLLYPYNKFLSLLPGPARLEEAEAVTPEHLGKILSYLKNMPAFRWILVDAGHRMDEITLKALELSDNLVLVTAPSVPALANTRKWLELLHLLDLEVPLEIWLNAWDQDVDSHPGGGLRLPGGGGERHLAFRRRSRQPQHQRRAAPGGDRSPPSRVSGPAEPGPTGWRAKRSLKRPWPPAGVG